MPTISAIIINTRRVLAIYKPVLISKSDISTYSFIFLIIHLDGGEHFNLSSEQVTTILKTRKDHLVNIKYRYPMSQRSYLIYLSKLLVHL